MAQKKVNSSRLTYIVVFSASGAVVLAALYLFAGRPAFRYAEDMRRRFVSYQDQLQKAETLIHSVANPQQALEEIERRTEEFAETSGRGRQRPKIIQALGQSAVGKPVTVISITPKEDLKTGEAALPQGVQKLFFEMVLTAPYQEIAEYARFMSGLPGVFTIESITVERQDAEASNQADKTGVLKAVFIISTYIVGAS